MAFIRNRLRGTLTTLAGAAAIATLAACGEDAVDIVNPENLENELFRTYVAMGNSITAGYQSGGINVNTQRESYANLLAEQMGTPFVIAELAIPGCRAPIVNFVTGARLGGAAAPPCALLTGPAPAVVNNVAVPGALIADATNAFTGASNTLTGLLGGGRAQVSRALDADPTFVTAWLGNNDVLGAATTGLTAAGNPAPGIASPGITPTATFTQRYQALVDSLERAGRLQGGVLIGVVNVTNIPYFFEADLLNTNPAVRPTLEAAVGRPIVVLNCPAGTQALIGIQIISLLRANAALPLSCAKIPGQAVAGDVFIVDAGERAALTEAVTTYNATIQQAANTLGFAYYDPNPLLVAQRAAGNVPAFPNLASTNAPFGPLFSLDGVHPNAAAHRLIANDLITAINARYGTTLTPIPNP